MKMLILVLCIGTFFAAGLSQASKSTSAAQKKPTAKPTPAKKAAPTRPSTAATSKRPTAKPDARKTSAKSTSKPETKRNSTAKPDARKTSAKSTTRPETKRNSTASSASKKPSSKPDTRNSAAKTASRPEPKRNSTSASATKKPSKKPDTRKTDAKKSTSKPAQTQAAAKPKPKPKPAPKPVDDKAAFEKAASIADALERANALRKFINDFPDSGLNSQARELLVTTATGLAAERISTNEIDGAVALYKMAVEIAPSPVRQQLFADQIRKIPAELFWRGRRAAALEVARSIEAKIGSNSAQLVELATFYSSVENGADAVRVAEKAAAADTASATAQTVLGLAYRVNFQLAESAAAYAKAVELDPASAAARRGLADMKRALGKPDEAAALYKELLTADASDIQSRTGLILSLFDAGKKAEAESELAHSLDENPNNLILLAGAAYWYAANKNGDRAVELAERAVAKDPRYIWSHIALARGLMLQGKPIDAEQVLLKARQYGNFPTMEYELASARFMAGFYRESVEGLQKSFSISDGAVVTELGGRLTRRDASFAALLADERRASILQPAAADDAEAATRLKTLMELSAAANAKTPDEAAVAALAEAFVSGDDRYKLHRQLYSASLLLDKKIAPAKALEIATAAVGTAESAVTVPNAGAAVMASELYESRTLALARNEFIQVPNVPRQTLSAILRGRIEDIAGWALLQQNKPDEAIVRLRRAISVSPAKSAWWRTSMWRLGSALQAKGKESEALDAYIKSYSTEKPDVVRYTAIESLYRKINGSIEGLEAKIGPSPLARIRTEAVAQLTEPSAAAPPPAIASPIPEPEKVKEVPTPTPIPEVVAATPTPTPQPLPLPAAETPTPTPETTPTPTPTPTPEPSPDVVPSPLPLQTPEPTPTPTEVPVETTAVRLEATPTPTPTPSETQVAQKEPPSTDPRNSQPSKELFEPIIITIPKPNVPKPAAKPATEAVPKDAGKQPPGETNAATSGEGRPRVVEGKPVQSADESACSIVVSQESVSLINNGGGLSILVGREGDGDLADLRAVSSSPDDITVERELDIAGMQGRALFVIRSASERTGRYTITFWLPCGKRDVTVNVR